MHVQRVITNETCNQNCWFCTARRPAERPAFVAPRAVRARIAAARAAQPRELVLTGGEPTLRSDLAALVRAAAAGGQRVVLETNGALIDAPRAAALAAAGLATARVQLTAWGETADAITRDPGGFAAACAGIRALAAAGVRVEVTTPIVRRNADAVGALPAAIAAAALPVDALVLLAPTTAPDAGELAPLPAIAAAITAVADAARRVGLAVRLDPTTFLPPCLFAVPERVAHLYALNRGNATRPQHVRVPACATCLVAERCPGLPAAALAGDTPPPLQPITSARLRRRVTAVGTIAEQVAREYLGRDEARGPDRRVAEYTLRVNFHCNQACEFCFVSTHLPAAAETAITAAIDTAGREGAALVLSGGEPTLNPRLVEYVQRARAAGVAAIELQSNAIRLADGDLAARLAAAGVDRAMISLHASTAAISDAITGAPGTFAQTVRGLDALMRTPIHVRLNFVFCQANRTDFPRYVDFVAARWPRLCDPAEPDTGVVVSFVASHTDVVPRTATLIPTFTDIMPALVAGLDRARALGLPLSGFDSMCGLPLCIVPAAARDHFATGALPDGAGDGEFVRAPACARCAAAHRCFGVRRGYAELHGTDELQPIGAPAAEARA